MRPASLVAWRWASLKYAGTVITAFVDRRAEVVFGILLQLAQDHRGNLGRRVGAVAQLEPNHRFAACGDAKGKELQFVLDVGEPAAHQALHGINGALGLRRSAARAPRCRPRLPRPARWKPRSAPACRHRRPG